LRIKRISLQLLCCDDVQPQFGKPMGEPKWLGGSVTEGFAVGSHVGVGTRLLYASLDCWFCNNSLPLPVGAYVVQV
jgi:hypothetical protein